MECVLFLMPKIPFSPEAKHYEDKTDRRSFIMFGAVSVQMLYQSMETMDNMEILPVLTTYSSTGLFDNTFGLLRCIFAQIAFAASTREVAVFLE
jgi:hypothetical protein